MRVVAHGLTYFIPFEKQANKEFRIKRRDETFAEVGECLFDGLFVRESNQVDVNR